MAFKHDCDECTFLGQIEAASGILADVYHHNHQTLIIREGDDGPEYAAFDIPVARAVARAVGVCRPVGQNHWLSAVILYDEFVANSEISA